MKLTTLCYIEQADKYLMLHRNKKIDDPNAGKWIGVGGKLEEGESPEDCLKREVAEETGLRLLRWRFRGVVSFISDCWETEQMFLFTADSFEGTLSTCGEGTLAWVPRAELDSLALWPGDRYFLKLLARDSAPFLMSLVYEGEQLKSVRCDGHSLCL